MTKPLILLVEMRVGGLLVVYEFLTEDAKMASTYASGKLGKSGIAHCETGLDGRKFDRNYG
jgi:hypothetical protein